jgi:hypothetical protein
MNRADDEQGMNTEQRENVSAQKKGCHMSHIIWWLLLSVLLVGHGISPAAEDLRTANEVKWGVKVLSIRLSAEGYMLDFRYRVLDSEKAMPLFDRKIKPYLVDEATGAMLVVPEPPKVGALRNTRKPQPDRNYFILFANPGRYVQKGKQVTVVIGDFKAEHLVVE